LPNYKSAHHIDEIAREHHNDIYDLKKYFSINLSYTMDEKKKKGLDKFLRELALPINI